MTHAKIATRISRSARWAFLESVLSAAVSMLTVVALARFLVPAEFGQAGLAIAVSAIIQATMLGGMPDALVRSPSAHSRLVDAAFWAMLGLGVAAAVLAGLVAGCVAYGLGDRELAGLIAGQGLGSIAMGAAAAPTGLLLRKMRTRALVNRTLVSKLFGLVVSVGLAWGGAGAWAIVGGNVVAQAAGALQLITTMRTPRLHFSDPGLAATLRIGALSGTQQSLGTLTTRGFILAFGAVYGVHAVGLFNFALRLVEESCGIVVTTLRRVTVTSFAAARRSGIDMHKMFRRGTSMIAHVAAPLFLGIAVVAPDAVPLFFGTQWLGAIPALQLTGDVPEAFRPVRALLRGTDRPMMIGLTPQGEREFYWTRPQRVAGDLERLRCDPAIAQLAGTLDAALVDWTGSGLDDGAGGRLGLSLRYDAVGRPDALTAFCRVSAASGGPRVRIRLLSRGGNANPALARCWADGQLRPMLLSLSASADGIGLALGLSDNASMPPADERV